MRKKRRKILLLVVLFCIVFQTNAGTALAAEGTTYTYTISVDDEFIRTQEAYLVSTVYLQRNGLVQPDDLYVYGDEIYIADTGNRRLVVFNKKDNTVESIEN